MQPSSGFETIKQLLSKRAAAPPGERCDFCAVPIFHEHGHLIDLKARRIMCACRPCALTMEPQGAAQGRYRKIPTRFLALGDTSVDETDWDALQIPIGLAFFFYNSLENRMMAFYPGPAGATESELSLETWNSIATSAPAFTTLEPDVEAVLIRRPNVRERQRSAANAPQKTRTFIVPIDSAYELVGLMRTNWRGFDGGEEIWERIDAYFQRIEERAAKAVAAAR